MTGAYAYQTLLRYLPPFLSTPLWWIQLTREVHAPHFTAPLRGNVSHLAPTFPSRASTPFWASTRPWRGAAPKARHHMVRAGGASQLISDQRPMTAAFSF